MVSELQLSLPFFALVNKKHLKNFGPICHCEPPPHCHSPGVATRRLRVNVHDDNDNA